MSVIVFHASAEVLAVATCARMSLDKEVRRNPRTCWFVANHSS
jgi:hypothetical protein